jgi:hypothetical protein
LLRDERDVTQDVKRDGTRLTLITRTKITSTITIIADPEPRAGRHARGRLRIAALDASLRLRRRGGGSCGWHGSCPRPNVGPLTRDAASAAGSATIRRETEEADGITRERDLGRGNSESQPVSPVLNSDVARTKCVNWGSRGDVAECASLLGSSACWVARRAWIVVECTPPVLLFLSLFARFVLRAVSR